MAETTVYLSLGSNLGDREKNLRTAVAAQYSGADCLVVAINDLPQGYEYGPEVRFEISEQGDCSTRGFASTGFAAVDMGSGGKTLRFAMP